MRGALSQLDQVVQRFPCPLTNITHYSSPPKLFSSNLLFRLENTVRYVEAFILVFFIKLKALSPKIFLVFHILLYTVSLRLRAHGVIFASVLFHEIEGVPNNRKRSQKQYCVHVVQIHV